MSVFPQNTLLGRIVYLHDARGKCSWIPGNGSLGLFKVLVMWIYNDHNNNDDNYDNKDSNENWYNTDIDSNDNDDSNDDNYDINRIMITMMIITIYI